MASRTRRSGTTPAPSQQRRTAQLPEYQQPQFALNAQAQRMIDNLYARHDFDKLQKAYDASITILNETAAEVNERVVERRDKIEKEAAKKHRGRTQDTENDDGEENDDAAEAGLQELSEKVDSMTKRLDEKMRKVLDGHMEIARTREILQATGEDARLLAHTQATLPPRNTQPEPRPQRDPDADDDEDDGSEYPEIEPTAPEEPTQTIKGPVDFYKEKAEEAKMLYQSRGLAERYAEQDAYRQFRLLVHQAQFPEGNVELPQPEDWFDEAGRARPGQTQRPGEDDDEEDIQIQRATTSIKCPITLREFEDPLTSKKCDHTFEASAIREMIRASTTRVNQSTNGRGQLYGGQPAVRCPVQSCEQILAEADLHKNVAIVRKIQRLQRLAELEREEALNNSRVEGGPEVIDDEDDEDAMDVDEIEADDVPRKGRVKAEKSTGRWSR